jgi:hypothetical protein
VPARFGEPSRSLGEGGSKLRPYNRNPGAVWMDRGLASLGRFAGALFLRDPSILQSHILGPAAIVVIASAIVGTPLFAILGGTAVLLFMHDDVTPATVLIETSSLSVSPTLPPIPLFTLAGFLLAEGNAWGRLRVFSRKSSVVSQQSPVVSLSRQSQSSVVSRQS